MLTMENWTCYLKVKRERELFNFWKDNEIEISSSEPHCVLHNNEISS